MIIHLVGTKAQYIKMAPVILETARKGLAFQLIYTGQHSETFSDLQSNFGLGPPDIRLTEQTEAKDRQSFIRWLWAARRAANSSSMRPVWNDASAIVVHGDTASTLLGARIAKRYHRPLVHIEAGLRSFNYLHPFPEEITRVLVSKSTALHCCPDTVAMQNLEWAKVAGERLLTHGNTLIDSLRMAQSHSNYRSTDTGSYGVFSMHRHENLFKKSRLLRALTILNRLSEIVPMYFVLHPVTQRRLENLGLLESLRINSRIKLVDRMDFFGFHGLLRGARFVATDGGSNQEECALLDIPCVLLRRATERPVGLGESVLLADLDAERILPFVRAAASKDRHPVDLPDVSPSKIIVKKLAQY
ncbi:MAG TPA: UDP-N-acetylglucosamine 2-epimerase [Gammaproteobacteria bacterium]|nr:UDP-N-acetylglucosamine 2-epimerase [Gammaproteobacteria bacterium]